MNPNEFISLQGILFFTIPVHLVRDLNSIPLPRPSLFPVLKSPATLSLSSPVFLWEGPNPWGLWWLWKPSTSLKTIYLYLYPLFLSVLYISSNWLDLAEPISLSNAITESVLCDFLRNGLWFSAHPLKGCCRKKIRWAAVVHIMQTLQQTLFFSFFISLSFISPL